MEETVYRVIRTSKGNWLLTRNNRIDGAYSAAIAAYIMLMDVIEVPVAYELCDILALKFFVDSEVSITASDIKKWVNEQSRLIYEPNLP